MTNLSLSKQPHNTNIYANVLGLCRKVFLDLLSAVGNNPHAAFGLQLVKEDKLTDEEAEQFLSKLALNLKENSPALLTELAVRVIFTQVIFSQPYVYFFRRKYISN